MKEIVYFRLDNQLSEYSLRINADNSNKSLQITLQRGLKKMSFDITFDSINDEVKIQEFLNASTNYGCLAICGLSLTGPILDCWRKNKGSWNGFLNCLKDQGFTLGTSAIACIAACG